MVDIDGIEIRTGDKVLFTIRDRLNRGDVSRITAKQIRVKYPGRVWDSSIQGWVQGFIENVIRYPNLQVLVLG